MNTQDHGQIVQRFFDQVMTSKMSSGTRAAVSPLRELVEESFVFHHPLAPGTIGDADGMERFLAELEKSIDFHCIVEEMVTQGERVAVRWTGNFIPKGEWMGAAALDSKATATGLSMFRVASGKIAESWSAFDTLSVLQQLGMIPRHSQAGAIGTVE